MSEKHVERYVRRYVRKSVKRFVRKNVKKICQKDVRKECQKICQKECQKICQKKKYQKICQKDVRKNVRRYVRKNVRRYVRRIYQKICQKECQKICQKERQKIAFQSVCEVESNGTHFQEMSCMSTLTWPNQGWHKSRWIAAACLSSFKKGTSWPKAHLTSITKPRKPEINVLKFSILSPSYSQWQPSPDKPPPNNVMVGNHWKESNLHYFLLVFNKLGK